MKRIVFYVFLLVAAASSSLGQSNIEAEIGKLDGELFEAIWKADAKARDRIVSEDFVYVTYAGEALTKAEWIATVKNPSSPGDIFKISDLKIRAYGDLAITTGHIAVVYREKDRTGLAELRYTNVYVKRQGIWKAVSGQVTPINKILWKREITGKDAGRTSK